MPEAQEFERRNVMISIRRRRITRTTTACTPYVRKYMMRARTCVRVCTNKSLDWNFLLFQRRGGSPSTLICNGWKSFLEFLMDCALPPNGSRRVYVNRCLSRVFI